MNRRNVYFFLPQVIVTILIIILGNLFWFNFSQTINETHLLTNSAITIFSTITIPILLFSVYLSLCALGSIFIPSKRIQIIILILSLVDYVMVTGGDYKDVIGELVICVGLFMFQVNFHNSVAFTNNKRTSLNRISSAFSFTSILISLVLAINFYSIYTQALTSDNLLVTNKLMKQILRPIVYLYLDDLKIKNIDETFGNYQVRMAKLNHQNASLVKSITLSKLNITQAEDTEPMKNLIKKSLDNSILKLAHNYGKTIPLVISFGLGIIIQTLLSISSFIANFITFGLLIICRKMNLITMTKVDYQAEKEIYRRES